MFPCTAMLPTSTAVFGTGVGGTGVAVGVDAGLGVGVGVLVACAAGVFVGVAGALADPVDGAVLLFRAESPDVAAAFAEADPYVRNGLVTRWEIRPCTVVIGGE